MGMEEKEGVCIVCGRTGQEGITVVSEFICELCEAEMVKTDVMDEKYPFFIHQLKRLWYKKNA
jgi:hypothetical protein